MALEANESYFLARQHSRIGRAVRLMTGRAAFKPHRTVLESERAALVAMAIQASRFVRAESLRHAGADAAVGIVAIDTTHSALRQLVVVRPLKLSPDVDMATRALLIQRGWLALDQSVGPVGVNFMAGRAGDLILGMTALQPAHVCGLIQVTAEADLVGCRGTKLAGIANVLGGSRVGVL